MDSLVKSASTDIRSLTINQEILLFDGVCNLCNGAVQFILDHEKPNSQLTFTSLQSQTGQTLLQKFNLSTQQFDSLVLVVGERFYTESTAALRLARKLKRIWSWLYWLIIIPKPIRDWGYKLIARNRYKWFGQKESCMIPTPELKARFLD
ncbi:thiol-disulfide oxidoreductase DCC family protein [Cytophagaceae bacterium YF14B1]|uniref:Thiol-disulfide oxidoreductase DCC family protein n=1 Tax=Xanthocytophaga flava TaxID=3048013 RepID=A0AAE3UB28_9BACT|nr:thiol-disulfide oxidoreductase DCC family protein [Xanthocytophaga flavus]MDJ1483963.1 thiol-disulfide oxidoreductase DCC family protein [Xanthocytophaga flavus]